GSPRPRDIRWSTRGCAVACRAACTLRAVPRGPGCTPRRTPGSGHLPRAGRDPARRPAYRLPGARPVPAGDGNRTGPRGATRAPALRDLDAGLPRETGGIPALRRGDTARRVRGITGGGPHV